MIGGILAGYAIYGLLIMVEYVVYVGRLIGKKYGCGMASGIVRFIKAGDTISNIRAVLMCVIIWPKLIVAMANGKWDRELTQMVDENDY